MRMHREGYDNGLVQLSEGNFIFSLKCTDDDDDD